MFVFWEVCWWLLLVDKIVETINDEGNVVVEGVFDCFIVDEIIEDFDVWIWLNIEYICEVSIDCNDVVGFIIVVFNKILVEVKILCISVVNSVEDIEVDTIKKRKFIVIKMRNT
jgi:hypothetical protein